MIAEQCKVSVILSVWNGERYVSQAVQSILSQTFQDFELVIVNDGSEDGTEEVLRPYLSLDQVVYRRQANAGVAAASNAGIALARGQYIAIQDHDDISLPTRLEQEVAALEANPECELVYSPASLMDDRGEVFQVWGGKGRQLTLEEAFYEHYLNGIFIPNAAVMMRRRHMSSLAPYKPRIRVGFDFEYFLRLLHSWPVYQLPEPLVKVRRGTTHFSLTSNIDGHMQAERAALRAVYCEYRHKAPRVTWRMYRRAMSNQGLREFRQHLWEGSKRQKIQGLLRAWRSDPTNYKVWANTIYLVRIISRSWISRSFGILRAYVRSR